MKPVNFQVQEHVIAASHIREYHRSTADDQEVALQLAVKQYSPSRSAKRNAKPVTIIGAHANGFPKVRILRELRRAITEHVRNFMSRYGTNYSSDSKRRASTSKVFG